MPAIPVDSWYVGAGDIYLDALESADVVAWRDDMAATPLDPEAEEPRYPSPSSVNSRLRLLRQILADPHTGGALPAQLDCVNPDRDRAVLVPDGLRRIRDQVHDHLAHLVAVDEHQQGSV